jgi:hypothetical protein
MNNRIPGAVLLVSLAGLPAQAQFWDSLINPDVQVTLTHPPTLGLKVSRVAFAPTTGRGAEDLVAACIADLAASEIEILDRSNTEKVLGEQKFTNSGLVDEKAAVEMGRLLGAGVMLFVKVNRLKAKHLDLQATAPAWTDKEGNVHPAVTTYTSKTQVEFNASIQAVDMATGRVFTQQRIAVAPALERSSTQGRPEFPSDTDVLELAMGSARTQVHRMLLPWTEQRKLIFYDDKDYGMKEAYRRLQLNDAGGALAKSLEALEAARADPKVKPKYLGRTNYNVGMCHFIKGDYQAALPFLKAARGTDPSHKLFAAAESECLRAVALQEEMTKVEARSIQVDPGPGAASPRVEPATTSKPAAGADSVEERLRRLEDLRRKGLLTPEEYREKKAQILKDL